MREHPRKNRAQNPRLHHGCSLPDFVEDVKRAGRQLLDLVYARKPFQEKHVLPIKAIGTELYVSSAYTIRSRR